MAPYNGTQQWHRVHSSKLVVTLPTPNGALQWHHAPPSRLVVTLRFTIAHQMAPYNAQHGTTSTSSPSLPTIALHWHPAMAPRPLHAATSNPPKWFVALLPLLEVRTLIAIAIREKKTVPCPIFCKEGAPTQTLQLPGHRCYKATEWNPRKVTVPLPHNLTSLPTSDGWICGTLTSPDLPSTAQAGRKLLMTRINADFLVATSSCEVLAGEGHRFDMALRVLQGLHEFPILLGCRGEVEMAQELFQKNFQSVPFHAQCVLLCLVGSCWIFSFLKSYIANPFED